jgi:hypothetical protein
MDAGPVLALGDHGQHPWATAWEGPVSASLLCTFPLEKEFGKGPKAQRDVFMERNEAMERNKHS